MSDLINNALTRSSGAVHFRCALQLNPFSYARKHSKSSFTDELEYNTAVVTACLNSGTQVIAVTDHHCIADSVTLIKAAEVAGIAAFPGFEAQTKDGVHMLCIFERQTSIAKIERYLGDCGVHDGHDGVCKYDVEELLKTVTEWGGVVIAPHALDDKGILRLPKGVARANAWKNNFLVACGVTGSVQKGSQYYDIIYNIDPGYKRERPMALIHCNDVCDPADLSKPYATTLIRMTKPTIEGLRQAFLDPESRVRLNSHPQVPSRTRLVAMAWEGGFLDGARLHFSDELNVLIGGRGTGKSTIVESIRYVLGLNPLGEDAVASHDRIIKNVIKSGTRIELLVEAHRPAREMYIIERTMPEPPRVRDSSGVISELTPTQIVSGLEVLGQHEIGEIARSQSALTQLLGRFARPAADQKQRRQDAIRALQSNRIAIVANFEQQVDVLERLDELPKLRADLKRYQDAGLEQKVGQRTLSNREERALKLYEEVLQSIEAATKTFLSQIPIDLEFLNESMLTNLQKDGNVSDLRSAIARLEFAITSGGAMVTNELVAARQVYDRVAKATSDRKISMQADYERTLRELQSSSVDAEAFVQLRGRIEQLEPLAADLDRLKQEFLKLKTQRATLIASFEEVSRHDFRRLSDAAAEINAKLGESIRIKVDYIVDEAALSAHFKRLSRASAAVPVTIDGSDFSITEFATAVGKGVEALRSTFRLSPQVAERLAHADLGWQLGIEEVSRMTNTTLSLNVGRVGSPDWRGLENLSTGQRATAVLILLMVDSSAPLIVDQPEDDLDNSFISDVVVKRLREAKGKRQFVLATHNPNIPVLGDAELIAGLRAQGEATYGKARVDTDLIGSIDTPSVAHFVEELLEGGKEAFVMRQRKYGF